jgi:superfamily II RNA helicase
VKLEADIEENVKAIKAVEDELVALGKKLAPLEEKEELNTLKEPEERRLTALRKEKEQLRKKEEQLRKKEEQLRKKEEQLRKEKEQLREKELLLLKNQKSKSPITLRPSKRNAVDGNADDGGSFCVCCASSL